MNQSFTVACMQDCTGPEIAPNLDECAALATAAERGADLVCLARGLRNSST